MDIEGLPTSDSPSGISADAVGATVLTSRVLGEDAPSTVPPSPPGSKSPSGWALIMASVAIALAVLVILGIGLGIGYVLDMRSGVDSFGVQSDAGSCTTST